MACLDGDEAGGARVKVAPVLSEPREVLLRDELLGFLLGCVEAVEDNPDEEVQKHKRYQKREAAGRREGRGVQGVDGGRAEGGGVLSSEI